MHQDGEVIMALFAKHLNKYAPVAAAVQLLCLLLASILEFFVIAAGPMFAYKSHYFLCVGSGLACIAFCAVTALSTPLRTFRRNSVLLLGGLMVVWFTIVELQHRSSQMSSHSISLFIAVYLLALPFAACAQDRLPSRGIQLAGKVYIAASLVLMGYSLLLMVDGLPAFLQQYVYWDGARLFTIHHPNTTARFLMVAIAFCLGLLAQCKSKQGKGALLCAALLLFVGIAFTNSRACVLLTCLLLAGNVFFYVFRGNRKTFLCAGAAAVLAAVVLFLSANGLFQWNGARIAEKNLSAQPITVAADVQSAHRFVQPLSAQPVTAAETSDTATTAPQGSWLSDLTTLNSRTMIWAGALQKIQHSPGILLWGTDSTRITTDTFDVPHTHNAWLEVLLRLGLPGLLLTLIFTWQAFWSALCLLWKPSAGLLEKNISMLLLALLATSMLEPFLFFTPEAYHPIDFIFFLCLGYVMLWKKQLKHKD